MKVTKFIDDVLQPDASTRGEWNPGVVPLPPVDPPPVAELVEAVVVADLMAWQVDAACRGEDPEPFFPKRGEVPHEAREFCRRCPVQAECLAHGLRFERFGVWGGTTELQRRRMRRQMGITRHELGGLNSLRGEAS